MSDQTRLEKIKETAENKWKDNAPQDVCWLIERYEKADAEVLRLDAEASAAYSALGELKENGFLECIVDPACGNCIVCRARKVLKGAEKCCRE